MKALPWVIGGVVVAAVGGAYWSMMEKKPKEGKTDLQKDMEKAAAEAKAKEPKKSLWEKTKFAFDRSPEAKAMKAAEKLDKRIKVAEKKLENAAKLQEAVEKAYAQKDKCTNELAELRREIKADLKPNLVHSAAAAAVISVVAPAQSEPEISIEPVTTAVSVDPETHEVTVTSVEPTAEETKVSETPVTES